MLRFLDEGVTFPWNSPHGNIEKMNGTINLNPAVGMRVRRAILCVVTGIKKTSQAAKGIHPPGESMVQVGRVSVTSPDPVSDVSRLLRHSRHCIVNRESILIWFQMDTRYPPAGMTDGAIRFTPDASCLPSSHACRETAADGLH
jgi:hypothetical protein